MARIPYVEEEDASAALQQLYESNRRFTGRVPNFHKLLGHVPGVYRWWIPFQNSVHRGTPSHVRPELRALASLATSEANRCRYCAAHGTRNAIATGVAPDKVRELADHGDAEPNPTIFDAEESLVIRWARAVTHNKARRDIGLFAELSATFNPSQIVELTVVIAARTFTNLIQEALWTDLEEPQKAQGVEAGHRARQPTSQAIALALHSHALLVADQLADDLEAGGMEVPR